MMGMDSLDAIRHRINMGDREGARLELVELLRADPDSMDGWALLAILLKDPAEQAKCYRQILRIDPDNRQAAAWLEALTRQLPESAAGEEPLGREDRIPSIDSILAGAPSTYPPGGQPLPEMDEIDKALRELDLPDLDSDISRQIGERGFVRGPEQPVVASPEARREEERSLDRLLDRLATGTSEDEPRVPSADEGEALIKPAPFSPEEIIRLAGGPLPAEERRKCPRCGAVVSRRESICSWCSGPLPAVEDS